MKPIMYFLLNSIELNRGGLTKASLAQASLFAEMGYKVYILTFNFNPKYPFIRRKLVELGKVHKDVTILNMFEELEGTSQAFKSIKPPKAFSVKKLAKEYAIHQKEGHNVYRAYQNGVYVKYYSLHDNNSLHFIDYFNENRYRTKREYYDPWGNLKKTQLMDYQLNKPRQSLYHDLKGNVFFAQWEDPKKKKVERIHIFDKDGEVKDVFVNDEVSHKVKWVKSVVNSNRNKLSVIVSDTRSTDEVLAKLKHKKVAKIWRLHSSHVDGQNNIGKKVRTGVNNLHKYDLALFLTEEQRNDVIERLGEQTSYFVLPNYYEQKESLGSRLLPGSKKDTKLTVIATRFSTLKRIEHTIRAFRKVVDKIPDAKLEIWGDGDQKDKLIQLIKEKKLHKNVFLKGYTQNPDKVYGKALFSTLTSKREGFPFSIMESMINRTPVISYDIKYGPKDMIEDGQNGWIIEESVDALAEKMLYMFENPETAIKMGQDARTYIKEHFDKKTYKQKWLEAVELAISKKK